MPARRRKQSNAMLYTLITFVGLFIAATTVAVVFYVKAEENRARLEDAEREMNDLASDRERQATGTTIGAKTSAVSWLGTMISYLDHTVSVVVGGVPEPTSAEVKVNNLNAKVAAAVKSAGAYVDLGDPNAADPNRVGLVPVITALTAKLESTQKAELAARQQLADLQTELDNVNKANADTQEKMLAEKAELQKEVETAKQDYADLQTLLQQTTAQQIQTLQSRLEQTENNVKTLNDTLLKTQAELKMAQDMMKSAQDELAKIEPGPNREVLAQELDGQVILIDDHAQVVHLNIGRNDRVYRGLTFSVYDRGAGIPKDGKGKAEVEVFDVADTYSAARIIRSKLNKPILMGDAVANLIWDSNKTNVFVIAGDFDLDNDEEIDETAPDKIRGLIEKWGARVDDAISVDTDFIVVGKQPTVLTKPTLEEEEIDPRARQRYEDSLQRLARYNELLGQAQTLWIPVFTYEKFLYFTGYEPQVGKAGAF